MNSYNEVDIIIDEITDCLVDKEGVEHKTEVRVVQDIKPNQYKEWNFAWTREIAARNEIYSLHILGNDITEGLISLIPNKKDEAVEIQLVESAPHNIGKSKIYSGVGPHLFAVAALRSFESGLEGYVVFEAKSDLISHYTETLGAKQIGSSQRMIINPRESFVLAKTYFPTQFKEG